TNWRAIVQLYARLEALTPSPVIALNRAIAVGMAEGPAAALTLLHALEGPAPAGYHPPPPARGRRGLPARARAHAQSPRADLLRGARRRVRGRGRAGPAGRHVSAGRAARAGGRPGRSR